MEEQPEKSLCVISESKRIQPSESMIKNPKEKEIIITKLLNAFRISTTNISDFRFPGSQPVSLDRSNLEHIKDDSYLVSLKSDGIRYLLFLTTCGDSPIAVMVDRALNIFEVEIWANESFFLKDTLFDGELVWEHRSASPTLLYLIFDVVVLRGEFCNAMSYSDRLMFIHKYILTIAPAGISNDDEQLEKYIIDEDKVFAMNNYYSMKIAPKKVLASDNVDIVWNERLKMAHMNDGLVFTKDSDRNQQRGTAYSTFKWKPDNTIDVLLEFTNNTNTPAMKFRDGTKIVEVSQISYNSKTFDVTIVPNRLIQCIVESEMRNSLTSKVAFVAECTVYIDNDSRLVNLFPIKRRIDKISPNNMSVVKATLNNVEENISFDEIRNFLSDFTKGMKMQDESGTSAKGECFNEAHEGEREGCRVQGVSGFKNTAQKRRRVQSIPDTIPSVRRTRSNAKKEAESAN